MTSKIPFNIIATGSSGNALVLNNFVLLDCGVNLKLLKPYIKQLKIVLLTHIHSDHFNKTTIRLLSQERPTLRFACGEWLAAAVAECGVPKENIDIIEPDKVYNYGIFKVISFPLTHNVPNCGYKVHFPNGKVIYATDTNNLNGVFAVDYDLYFIEANYVDEEIQERIRQKKENGEYIYENQVLKNHLSKAKCDDFIYKNIGAKGEYVYMHCHQSKKHFKN